ncbi:MAG TPA: arginine deiminase-related protein [Woeseiaceae bacterium]|nr:arginine deiminase-related protein [Woeseiaceae bacterium]
MSASPVCNLNDMVPTKESQLASAVLMIRPARFQSNPQTAESNRFQGRTAVSPAEQHAAALAEFEGLKNALEFAGIRVVAFDDTPEPHTPDAIFPNNWVSFHADGTVVLYPMEASNRRPERRRDIVDSLADDHGFAVRRVIDLSHHEKDGHFLEGTGSMVLDRSNRIAYACLSSRTHLDALGEFAQRLDYEVLAFDAVDQNRAAIYHTNVLMNIGEKIAVVCDESIPRETQRRAVLERLASTGHEVIRLTFAQLQAFAGNMLELKTSDGQRVTAMSEQSRRALNGEQLATLGRNGRIVSAPIDTIECSAGGSVRCMLAEIYLPEA